jgi:hypothetical protein
MTGMCMHYACHPGGGMFARFVWLLTRMLMGVGVIHGVLVLSRSGTKVLDERSRREDQDDDHQDPNQPHRQHHPRHHSVHHGSPRLTGFGISLDILSGLKGW